LPDVNPLPTIRDRIVSDFLMPSRLDAYRRLLEGVLAAGYRVCSVERIWQQIRDGGPDPALRYFVLRHDVDTDPGTAAAMWRIERELGVRSSYFFRLSTMDLQLMAGMAAAEGDVSYHYEELATVAKRRGLRDRSEALRHLPEAQDAFRANLARIRGDTGLPMRVVASHGDFVNNRLAAPNWLILADQALRSELDIELETYDRAILDHLPRRISDRPYPRFWDPIPPTDPIDAGAPVISLLVHPRHWRVDRIGNARHDLVRIIEGVRFAVATHR
jgi:hypothetical protein